MEEEETGSVEDEYIVPQVVKVVSLAHLHNKNNILLVDATEEGEEDDPLLLPPSAVDVAPYSTHSHSPSLSPEESILGLAYGDELDEEAVNHKFASFTLSSPTQPDERVDFFSSSASTNLKLLTPRHAHNQNGRSQEVELSSLLGEEEDEDQRPPPAIPCTSFWEELRFCQAPGCNKPACKKCSACKAAFYCSEPHHAEDWPRHLGACIPFRLTLIGGGVRAPVASRNIPEGTLILSEKPVLVFPLPDPLGPSQLSSPLDLPCILSANTPCVPGGPPACLGCAKPFNDSSAEVFCGMCGLPLCSYQCQLHIAHKAGECDAVTSSGLPLPLSLPCRHRLHLDVEILRALQLEKYDRGGWELLLEMRSHWRVEEYKRSERFHRFMVNLDSLVPMSARMSGYNKDLIGDVHAIINSLSIRLNINSPFKLLFNRQPQFSHDCVPNTLYYVEDEHGGEGSRMRLLTKAAVPILKGQLITVDFTPSPFLPYEKRRQVLCDLLSIRNCLCQRCQHPSVMNDLTAEIKCYSCTQGTVCPETPPLWQESVWACRICQEEIPYSRIEGVEDECYRELIYLLNSAYKSGSLKPVEDWIRRKGTFELNPKHHLIYNAWCYCEEFLRPRISRIRSTDPSHVYTPQELEYFELLGKYADALLEHMDSIRPGIYLDKGLIQIYKFYALFTKVCHSYQSGLTASKDFVTLVMKSLKILQSALQTLTVYEGYNAPSVLAATQDATATLATLKEYMNGFLKLKAQEKEKKEKDSSSGYIPLPPLHQLVPRTTTVSPCPSSAPAIAAAPPTPVPADITASLLDTDSNNSNNSSDL